MTLPNRSEKFRARAKNQISELPDDILVSVFKFLTMKEAGRTSVLSKRWRHVWAYNPRLNFDSGKLFDEFQLGTKSLVVEGPKYLHWVDKVVSSHKAPVIDKFRVMFNISLLGNCSDSIDNWFRFAMEKKVKKLAIDFSLYYSKDCKLSCHTFPSLFLCNSLTSIELGCVNITGEILESFLCNCRAVKHLSVKYSDSLERLKVSGPSLNLKHLKIYKCPRIKELEISAPNLVSVCYFGPKINVQFKSAPKLAKVFFGSSYAHDLGNICSDISSCLSQIKAFRLDSWRLIKDRQLIIKGFVFTRLKKLDLMARPFWNDDLYRFIFLVKACPLLHHFTLRLVTNKLDYNKSRELRKRKACSLKHLKIVEILGFVGHAIDLEFAAYLMESVVSLDKIIADTRVEPMLGCPEECEVTEERKQAMKRAELLNANVKPGTKLEIR